MTTIQQLLAELPEGEAIPLPWVRDHVGWNRDMQSYAVRTGAVRPLRRRAVGGAYLVSRDEAVKILVAFALAMAASVAVVVMLRAINETGLDPVALASSMKT